MNAPLALLLSARGTIATQLGERLETLRYRLITVSDPAQLGPVAAGEKPMVVLADLEGRETLVVAAVSELRGQVSTAHIPVIGFRREMEEAVPPQPPGSGFTIVVTEAAILAHLPQLLERALEIP